MSEKVGFCGGIRFSNHADAINPDITDSTALASTMASALKIISSGLPSVEVVPSHVPSDNSGTTQP